MNNKVIFLCPLLIIACLKCLLQIDISSKVIFKLQFCRNHSICSYCIIICIHSHDRQQFSMIRKNFLPNTSVLVEDRLEKFLKGKGFFSVITYVKNILLRLIV